jgi:tRNA/tmRNA/rRNA uracil-C5-methylase (TrmA/RlmC/RlmD family)
MTMTDLNKYKEDKKNKMNAEADAILEGLQNVDIDALYRRITNKDIESENEKIDNTLLNAANKKKGEESLESERRMFEFLQKNKKQIKALENEARRLSDESKA